MKVSVITGGNSGIGLEAAVQLAELGDQVVLCCRSPEKAQQAKAQVVKRARVSPHVVHLAQLDLADLDNVASFRERYAQLPCGGLPVDRLILNAGVMAIDPRQETKQGVEMQVGTNVVGHFLFTAVMLSLCQQSKRCHIVAVSSMAHNLTKGIKLSDFDASTPGPYRKWDVYSQSKLGNLVFMAKLNKLLEARNVNNVIVVGCHPGYSATNRKSCL